MGNAVLKIEYDQCSERVQFRGPLGEKANRKIFNLGKRFILLARKIVEDVADDDFVVTSEYME